LAFGGTSSSSAGMTGTAGIQGCTGTSQTTTRLPPVLEFLVDYSGSMNDIPAGQTLPKWQATRDALIQAFTTMQDGTGTGLIYYPNTRNRQMGNCINRQQAVPIAPLDATVRQALIASLTAKRTDGATPTHDAFVFAAETLAASTVMGNKNVVLVTDGSPTFSLGCVGDGMAPVDNAPLVQAVAMAATTGIKTFVIGSPGSEDARSSLSQMATQGGTAPPGCSDAGPNYCHFDMTTAPDLATALNAAFAAITGSVITCRFTIPAPASGKAINYDEVNVNFTSTSGNMQIGRDPDPAGAACTRGWQYSPDKSQIILCEDACNLVKADPNAKVDVVLGCKTIPA
jgi:hypothetical protein